MSYREAIESCSVYSGRGKVQDQQHRNQWMLNNIYVNKIRGVRPKWESEIYPEICDLSLL